MVLFNLQAGMVWGITTVAGGEDKGGRETGQSGHRQGAVTGQGSGEEREKGTWMGEMYSQEYRKQDRAGTGGKQGRAVNDHGE